MTNLREKAPEDIVGEMMRLCHCLSSRPLPTLGTVSRASLMATGLFQGEIHETSLPGFPAGCLLSWGVVTIAGSVASAFVGQSVQLPGAALGLCPCAEGEGLGPAGARRLSWVA